MSNIRDKTTRAPILKQWNVPANVTSKLRHLGRWKRFINVQKDPSRMEKTRKKDGYGGRAFVLFKSHQAVIRKTVENLRTEKFGRASCASLQTDEYGEANRRYEDDFQRAMLSEGDVAKRNRENVMRMPSDVRRTTKMAESCPETVESLCRGGRISQGSSAVPRRTALTGIAGPVT
uniref:Uncharacterized protein n=1 Tax=Vespula pensylvanica TaxID=30213 RepID=A0A834PG08_VESPE|nr:hypothetical protein H0235_001592 [Vespula pensylvanica]